jgi:hypothetical protein
MRDMIGVMEPSDIFYSGRPLGWVSDQLDAIAGDEAADSARRDEASRYLGDVARILHIRDQLMVQTTLLAAATVEVEPVRQSFLEARLEDAVIDAWALAAGGTSTAREVRPTSVAEPCSEAVTSQTIRSASSCKTNRNESENEST